MTKLWTQMCLVVYFLFIKVTFWVACMARGLT